jgi:hypothetical protein
MSAIGCIIFGGFPRQLRRRVPDLSSYATKMGLPLLRASLRAAFVHWLDEIREKSGKPIGVYFETPRDIERREIFPAG